MPKIRVISRIDIKNEFAIKGIQLEGLRKVGDPNELAKKYYHQGVDELIFMDAVASYYDRNSSSHIIEKACEDIFIPITVGGGLRNLNDIQQALNSGADKVAINTQAHREPLFIKEASKEFGSQCIVGSVVAKKISSKKWECYIENGREPTGVDVMEWIKKLQELGIGELMITSVDQEGTKRGFDIELCEEIANISKVPVIISGGAGSNHDIVQISKYNIDGVAIASLLHYDLTNIKDIKDELLKNNLEVHR
jgi:cyclase